MKVKATDIDYVISDDDELSYVYIKWGEQGCYIDITKEENEDDIYCELFDQSNGRPFETIAYELKDKILKISVQPPESLTRQGLLNTILLDISSVSFNNDDLNRTLLHIFSRNL